MINLYAHWRESLGTWASPDDIIAYWPTKGSGPSHKFSELIDGIRQWPGSVRYFRLRMFPDEFGPHGYYVLFAGNVYAMEDCPALACLSLDAIDAVNKGHLELVYFFVHETFDNWNFADFQNTLYDRLKALKITRPGSVRVVISTRFDNIVTNELVTWIYYPWHGGEAQQQAKKFLMSGPPPLVDPASKSKSLLCLNNRMTPHRYLMLKRLEYLGISTRSMITVNHTKSQVPNWQDVIPYHTESDDGFQQWLSVHPEVDQNQYTDSTHEITGVKKGWVATNFFYRNIGWDLVQETHCDLYGGSYVTVNTWRAMLMGIPFLINGTPKSLSLLKDLGYRTFDGIIDESYDQELDTARRIKMIAAQAQRICEGKISYQWPDLEQILLHNQQLAWNHRYLTDLHDALIQ